MFSLKRTINQMINGDRNEFQGIPEELRTEEFKQLNRR